MAHEPGLVERILAQVRGTYPEDGHTYVLERRLVGQTKNIQPDIQVLDRDGRVVCVVEIGYTRPEKLREYSRLGIPDIRWVDRTGTPVNPFAETTMHVVVKATRHRPAPGEVWRVVETFGIDCEACLESYRDELDEPCDEVPEEDRSFVLGEVWSNGRRAFALVQCEVCGGAFLAYRWEMEQGIQGALDDDDGLYVHDKFLAEHYKQRREDRDMKVVYAEVPALATDYLAVRALRGEIDREWTATFDELVARAVDKYELELRYDEIPELQLARAR